MSSRNATASWSGYAHQGKIGLLIALRQMQSVNLQNLPNYRVELETKEDVKLCDANSILEVHQVKAYTSKTTIGGYTTALKEFEACPGANYLHTICEITNWSDLTVAQNPGNVERYPYSATRNYCPLNDIDDLILQEIRLTLVQMGHAEAENIGWRQQCYQEYFALLDDRIRSEHANKPQDQYNVGFTLNEIGSLLGAPSARHKATIFAIRRELFAEYLGFIDLLESNGIQMTADHEAFVTELIKKICLLDDDKLERFLCRLFPATTHGKTLAECQLTHDFFMSDPFSTTFLATVIEIQGTELILENGTFPHYKADQNYLATALSKPEIKKGEAAKGILQNDKLNMDRFETDFIINEHLSGSLHEIAGRQIPRRGSFMDEKEIEFIKREDAVNQLN